MSLVSALRHSIQRFLAPSPDMLAAEYPQSRVGIQYARELFLLRTLRVAALLGTLVYVISSVSLVVKGFWSPLFIHTTGLILVWLVTLARHIAYRMRAGLLIVSLYLFAVNELVNFGYSGDAHPFLFAFTMLSLLFFDGPISSIALIISTITLAIGGGLIAAGICTPIEIEGAIDWSTAITTPIVFFMVTGTLQVGFRSLLQHWARTWQREVETRDLLQEERSTLELRVAQRTHELVAAHDAVVEASRITAAQNVELDAFAHTVAHELKTPLTVLIGSSQMLQRNYQRLAPEQIKQLIEAVVRNGTKMDCVIDELLLLASVRTANVVKIREVAMETIIAEVEKRLADEIELLHAIIIKPDTWASALGYSPWIEQVWLNYMSNALKYGGRPPRVELGADPPSNGFVRFWVRDNGSGLSVEQQDRLFTAFTRLHSERVAGHGVGLTIVKRMVVRLGGEAGVESSEGAGSLFYFTLPAA